MEPRIAHVTDVVLDRTTRHPAWMVVATFAAVEGEEARCVDYRVRTIPSPKGSFDEPENPLDVVQRAMVESLMDQQDVEDLGAFPRAGIPRYVFEQASQTRLLDRARAQLDQSPEPDNSSATQLLRRVKVDRQGRARRGRPPKLDLVAKLRVLADIEAEYAAGTRAVRATIAKRHHMSEGSVRDLLHWARNTSEPRMFSRTKPGERGGRLEPVARRLLEEADLDG